jgi:hypothetical protein
MFQTNLLALGSSQMCTIKVVAESVFTMTSGPWVLNPPTTQRVGKMCLTLETHCA